jgi:hypothetical protein
MLGNSLVAEQLVALQEGLHEVSYIIIERSSLTTWKYGSFKHLPMCKEMWTPYVGNCHHK